MNTIRPVMGLPNLAWLRSFEAAARTCSFAAAATELRLSSGAISYQIRALEAHLGFSLFERLPRGVKLTAMGVAYLPPVRKAFEELADSTIGLFGGSERVQITVNAPVSPWRRSSLRPAVPVALSRTASFSPPTLRPGAWWRPSTASSRTTIRISSSCRSGPSARAAKFLRFAIG